MIDLYNLELEIGYGADGEQIEMSRGEAIELIVRLRQAEKDAARYRMIKSIAKVIECEEFDMDMLDGQDLDAMVDECIEAMRCNK